MKPDFRNIDDVLERCLPSASRPQTESAGARVLDRLRSIDRLTAQDIEAPLPSPDVAARLGWRRTVLVSAAAAALVAASIGTAVVWRQADPIARVEAVDGSLDRIVDGGREPLTAGALIESGDSVRTTGSAGAMLVLADGSYVEVRSPSEFSLERATDGLGIRLRTGGIIVTATKQGGGHLYVHTKDVRVSVVGTVFLVNAEASGSRVAVIEGEVRVREGATETNLRPGEHVATSPTLAARPLAEEVAWSRRKDVYLAILAAFEKGMAETSGPLTRLGEPGSARTRAIQDTAVAGRQEFEEASIRQCDPDNMPPTPAGARGGGPNSFYMTPGRTYALCLTLATLIRTAYDYGPVDLEFMDTADGRSRRRNGPGMRFDAVYGLGVEDGRRVRGGPDWVLSERYTIEAVADGPADVVTMRGPMLQALLERRFQLKVHIEAEQLPGYALVVAPGGLKMKPFQEGDCAREVSDAVKAERARRGWTGPVLITEAAHFGITPNCGVYGETNGPNYHFEHVWSMPGQVAGSVGRSLGVRVIDRTNITDRFIYSWEFGIDEQTPGALEDLQRGKTWNPKPGWDDPMTIPKAPSIFIALEQQLGLKLEPIRVPREFIVIDRVEKPSPN
jgi:uncharacterized protein (TIGR03435 family)